MSRLDYFPKNDLIKNYRNVFGGPDGPKVLAHMLYEYGIFEETSPTPEDQALKNHGARLLQILGGGEVEVETIQVFVRHLIAQPLKKEVKDE